MHGIPTCGRLLAGVVVLLAAAGAASAAPSGDGAAARLLRNPLDLRLPDGSRAESCADPTVLRGQRPRDPSWLMVCTRDPLNDHDRQPDGSLRFHPLPTFISHDLQHWTYAGDALPTLPTLPPQAAPGAGLWAPELAWVGARVGGQYRLYYTITDVVDALSPEPGCKADSAIGVASSASPFGPWVFEADLVVPPRRAGPGCNFHWTFDPDLVRTPDGRYVLFYGSYGGGLWAQPLDPAAVRPQGPAVAIARSHRYEGAEVVQHGGHWWLFASAADCCNGELTGYGVFVGRAKHPLGPYLDRDGHAFLDADVGGTPVLVQNGNGWVGPGHNSVFADAAGRWWTAYHALDRRQARWTGSTLTRRPVLLDQILWVEGWPQVPGGPSDGPRQAGSATGRTLAKPERLRGRLLWQDAFDAPALASRWQWRRQPAVPAQPGNGAGVGGLQGQPGLHLVTETGDLHLDTNDAAVLLADLPAQGDLWIETMLSIDLPADGDLSRPVQAGLLLYADDDRYVKLVHVALQDTRQTEFAVEQAASDASDASRPRYGSAAVGPPGARTRLALLLRRHGGASAVTAFTQADGGRWVRGATWLHPTLGARPRLGLMAMGGAGHHAIFHGVQVRRAQPSGRRPAQPRSLNSLGGCGSDSSRSAFCQ